MPELHEKINVVFAHLPDKFFPTLVQSLRELPEVSIKEISCPLPSISSQIHTINPDIMIFYAPVATDEIVECLYGILKDNLAIQIIFITNQRAPATPRLPLTKVVNYVIPPVDHWQNNPKALKDIGLHVKSCYARKRKTEKGLKIQASPALEHSFVLPDHVLNKYIIALGASTGGTEAQSWFFRRLPPKMPGMVVVQHMPPVFTKMFADRLNNELPFDVMEAQDNILIAPNTIHIAPGDRQLEVQKRGNLFYTRLGGTEKVSGHCPSVDVLFSSVAQVIGNRAIGIILTGMGADGAEGLLKMRKKGCFTIGQDEDSCVVYGMPRKAYENGAVVTQASLSEISKVLVTHLSKAN